MKILELTEYQSSFIANEKLPESLVNKLEQNYQNYVKIIRTKNQWKLTAQGWVGFIPITPNFCIQIKPKVPIKNLFYMLEYVYRFKSIRLLDGLINCESLAEFYNYFAGILARKILARIRQGIYREYLPKTDKLPYIRGRLDVRSTIEKPWDVKLKCYYQEQTADVEDNQILAWTLHKIRKTGICQPEVKCLVGKSDRLLQGIVTLKPVTPEDCIRSYHRLNQDYQELHALCRFFLANNSPSYETGASHSLPFLIDMAKLYENFVAEWLQAHLPSNLKLKVQSQVNFGILKFKIDLIVYEVATGKPRYILDTKYKLKLTNDDVFQVVTYAVSKNCPQAVLVYPTPLTQSLDETLGNIHVRSLVFSLNDDLEKAGKAFLKALLK